MAKQKGPFYFTGTIGNLTGYELDGEYIVKKKTEHKRHNILKHRNWSNTRRNAGYFKEAQKIASEIYRKLPMELQDRKTVWYPLRNRAQELVRKGISKDEIVKILHTEFLRKKQPIKKNDPLFEKEEIILGRHIGRMDPDKVHTSIDNYAAAIKALLNKDSNQAGNLNDSSSPLRPTKRRRPS